jgi:hypothetical protein
VAYVAFYDWLVAKNLETRMEKFLDPLVRKANIPLKHHDGAFPIQPEAAQQPRSGAQSAVRKVHHWTRTHSHYALMGGYVYDMSKLPINIAPQQASRLTLTINAILYLAEHEPHLIPDISDEDIRDKSKADAFTKTLVCLQASWFLAQVIGRLATKHPMSLLEMNTFLHALCCLIIYGAWWHKPLDIEEPTSIDPTDGLTTCLLFMCYSGINSPKYQLYDPTTGPLKEYVVLKLDSQDNQEPENSLPQPAHPPRLYTNKASTNTIEEFVSVVNPNPSSGHAGSSRCYSLEGLGLSADREDPSFWRLYEGQRFCRLYFGEEKKHTSGDERYIRLSRENVEFYILLERQRRDLEDKSATQHMLLYQAPSYLPQRNKKLSHWPDSVRAWKRRWLTPFVASKKTSESSDQSTALEVHYLGVLALGGGRSTVIYFYYLGVLAAGSIYGGVHLIAWHNGFPTTAERYMWRISCLVIASPFPICLVLVLMWMMLVFLDRSIRAVRQPSHNPGATMSMKTVVKDGTSIMVALIGIAIAVAFAVAYPASRIYIVAESFRNLGHLPLEVYMEPDWSKYIPHFGAG